MFMAATLADKFISGRRLPMLWKIQGAMKETGQDVQSLIDAPTKVDAIKEAGKRGLLINSIEAASPAPPSPEAVAAYAATLPPGYGGLRVAASVLFVFSLISYLSAAILVLSAIVNAGQIGSSADGFNLMIYALAAAVSGAIQHGLSAACLAVRDIAINSFKK
jgi:hypothetical protein